LPSTFSVTNLDDSGAGSLRDAITRATDPVLGVGPDRIVFNVAGTINVLTPLPVLSDPGTIIDGWTAPGFSSAPVVVLHGSDPASGSGLVITSANNVIRGLQMDNFGQAIEIAGTSASGNVLAGNYLGTDGRQALPNAVGVILNGAPGNLIGTNADGVNDAAERNVISGNELHGIFVRFADSTGNVIAGNFIGTDASGTRAVPNGTPTSNGSGVMIDEGASGNFVGTNGDGRGDAVEGNLLSGNLIGVSISGPAHDNVIAGNKIGTDVSGRRTLPNTNRGVNIGGTANRVGSNADGVSDDLERNVISGNALGVVIAGVGTTRNVLAGNFIGTDVSGAAALGNGGGGVVVSVGATDNVIGGTLLAQRNVIAASAGGPVFGHGILIADDGTDGNQVLGNFIGTDRFGYPLGNAGSGVEIRGNASNNLIGGVAGGARNLIAFNGAAGVGVESGAGNTIRGNMIHDNGGLGIDLGPAGVTVNDPGDADTGANGLQNFPALTSVVNSGGSTTVQGGLLSTRNSTFTLDFYSSAAADPSGFGEGATFLGSRTVTTGVLGAASFTVTLPGVPVGQVLTATATTAGGSTSEFSEARGVTSGPALSINDVTVNEGNSGVTSAFFTVSLSAASTAAVQVQYATADNTASAPDDYQAVSGTLTFAPGVTSLPVTVPVNGDLTDEPDETFFVKLSGATGAGIADGLGVGTIINDDLPPSVSVNDVSVPEGNSGTVGAVFTVHLSAPSGKVVAVDFATADGTALAPGDYQSVSGSLVFAPGETDQTITVPVNGDLLGEANETFLVNLTNPVDSTIADGQGVGVILNDDPVPALRDRSVTPQVAEGSVATLRGTISLAAPQDQFILEVSWGDDSPTQVVTFPAGSDGQVVELSHRYANNNPAGTPYTVHAAWHNQYGGGNAADFAVTVANVAPTVEAGPDVTLPPGGAVNRTGSFTDPGTDTWTATVDYGDGSGAQALRLDRKHHFHLHHKYASPGRYRVVVQVADGDGGVGTASFLVLVSGGGPRDGGHG
jgi:hypothetical protein